MGDLQREHSRHQQCSSYNMSRCWWYHQTRWLTGSELLVLDINEEWKMHLLDCIQVVCTSLQTDIYVSTSRFNFCRLGDLFYAQPCQSTEGKLCLLIYYKNRTQGTSSWFKYSIIKTKSKCCIAWYCFGLLWMSTVNSENVVRKHREWCFWLAHRRCLDRLNCIPNCWPSIQSRFVRFMTMHSATVTPNRCCFFSFSTTLAIFKVCRVAPN